MPSIRDWLGKRQGKLLVIRQLDSRADGQAMWECRCDCGTLCAKSSGNLRLGTKSCSTSCGVAESNRKRAVHGVAHGKEWKAWTAAKQRCFNQNHPQFHNYGGRGITMHSDWVSSFATFYAHIGPAPSVGRGAQLDRIDNEKGYVPDNVRWATPTQQIRNTRRNLRATINGESLSLHDICARYGLPYTTVSARWRRGLRGADLATPKRT